MSSVVISGDTSGAITLAAPAVSGTNTATLPAATGTVMVSGNMPAFSVYKNGDQSVSSGAWTKVTFSDEVFDTNNNFASSRFTPTVSGYYQFNWAVEVSATSCTRMALALYKNGTALHYSGFWTIPSGTWDNEICAGALVYLNGSTDYVELYVYPTGTSPTIYSSSAPTSTWFNGSLVRGA
jgi:hypothetical protein